MKYLELDMPLFDCSCKPHALTYVPITSISPYVLILLFLFLTDSELSAKELQCKYWKEKDGLVLYEDDGSPKKKESKPLEIDTSLFGGLDFA